MSKKKGGLFKFIAGLGIGAAAGILLAPESGEKSRKKLKKYLESLVEQAKQIDIDEVRDSVEAKVYELTAALEDLDKETALKIARKKAGEIQDMANELVDYAIEKGTPILKDTANQAREKAIVVTKEVLKKLEEKEK